MERVSSPEERMRRAEEIYYRRRAQGVRVSTTSVNIGTTNKVSLGKKMIIQIIICILIYCSFWALRNYKSVFSENVINHTKAFLSYDINFVNLYNQSREYLNSHFNNIIKTNSNQNGNEVNAEDADKEEKNDDENKSVEGSDDNNANDSNSDGSNSNENDSDEANSVVNNEENMENKSEENSGIRRWNRSVN